MASLSSQSFTNVLSLADPKSRATQVFSSALYLANRKARTSQVFTNVLSGIRNASLTTQVFGNTLSTYVNLTKTTQVFANTLSLKHSLSIVTQSFANTLSASDTKILVTNAFANTLLLKEALSLVTQSFANALYLGDGPRALPLALLTRLPDWPTRFAIAIESARNKPFEWGTNDCCMFAANVVLAITGVDPAQEVRGTYDSAITAATVIGRQGGLENAISAVLGAPIDVRMAKRGDVIIYRPRDDWPSAMICTGIAMVGPGETGMVTLPVRMGDKAWAV